MDDREKDKNATWAVIGLAVLMLMPIVALVLDRL